jgi:hypothetical protein
MLADSAFFLYFLIPAVLIGLCWLVEGSEHSVSATVGLGLVLVVLQLFTDVRPFTYMMNDPLRAGVIAAAYIAIGIGYLWYKWSSYTRMAARNVRAYMAKYSNVSSLDAARYLGYRSAPLNVGHYKARIMGWMIYWPLSFAWTLLNDPLYRLYVAIYDKIAYSLQEISDRAFSDIQKSE